MNTIFMLKRIVIIMALILGGTLFLFFWTHMDLIMSLASGHKIAETIPIKVKNKLCYVNHDDNRDHLANKTDLKMIYFVTPTYPRPEQIPELTRLSHTLMHIPRLHWIVADDQPICSDQVLNILRRTGLPFTLLSSPKPYVIKSSNTARGVSNRRAALSWIRENVQEGILYFGDDDNTYDLLLFQEIRATKRISMFPVGLIGDYGVSSPVVNEGKVVAFFDSWPGGRTYPVDMAGFAINIDHLPASASMPYIAGLEEDRFLVSSGVKIQDIEPLADNCSKVYVWHTKTVHVKKPNIKLDVRKIEQMPGYTGFVDLLKEIVALGVANISPDSGIKSKIIRNSKIYDVMYGLQ